MPVPGNPMQRVGQQNQGPTNPSSTGRARRGAPIPSAVHHDHKRFRERRKDQHRGTHVEDEQPSRPGATNIVPPPYAGVRDRQAEVRHSAGHGAHLAEVSHPASQVVRRAQLRHPTGHGNRQAQVRNPAGHGNQGNRHHLIAATNDSSYQPDNYATGEPIVAVLSEFQDDTAPRVVTGYPLHPVATPQYIQDRIEDNKVVRCSRPVAVCLVLIVLLAMIIAISLTIAFVRPNDNTILMPVSAPTIPIPSFSPTKLRTDSQTPVATNENSRTPTTSSRPSHNEETLAPTWPAGLPVGRITWQELGTTIFGLTSGALTGRAVALSNDGNTLAFGSPETTGRGRVDVFQFKRQSWEPIGSGTPLVGRNGDEFGSSVSLSSNGTIVAVGAPMSDSSAGEVHVFVLDEELDTWSTMGQALSGDLRGDRFGSALDLNANGTVLAVGAYKAQEWLAQEGYVRTYRFQLASWVGLGENSQLIGTNRSEQFGWAVSLSADGNTLAASSNTWAPEDGSSFGSVLVYHLTNQRWVQAGQRIEGAASFDELGTSLALSARGDSLICGSWLANSQGIDSGHATVYRFNSALDMWIQVGGRILGKSGGEKIGWASAISDDGGVVVVSSYLGGIQRSGIARTYRLEVGNWEQIGEDFVGDVDEKLGMSVALSGSGHVLALGAIGSRHPVTSARDAGSVRVVIARPV